MKRVARISAARTGERCQQRLKPSVKSDRAGKRNQYRYVAAIADDDLAS